MTAAVMSARKKTSHARAKRAACKAQATTKYTVILLRPDYVTDDYGQDTFLARVEGVDPAQAVANARKDALTADGLGRGDWGKDYHVIAVLPGYVPDLNPERR